MVRRIGWQGKGVDVEEDRCLQHIKHKVAQVNQYFLPINQQKTYYLVKLINKMEKHIKKP